MRRDPQIESPSKALPPRGGLGSRRLGDTELASLSLPHDHEQGVAPSSGAAALEASPASARVLKPAHLPPAHAAVTVSATAAESPYAVDEGEGSSGGGSDEQQAHNNPPRRGLSLGHGGLAAAATFGAAGQHSDPDSQGPASEQMSGLRAVSGLGHGNKVVPIGGEHLAAS